MNGGSIGHREIGAILRAIDAREPPSLVKPRRSIDVAHTVVNLLDAEDVHARFSCLNIPALAAALSPVTDRSLPAHSSRAARRLPLPFAMSESMKHATQVT
jgi:hypothetical protein